MTNDTFLEQRSMATAASVSSWVFWLSSLFLALCFLLGLGLNSLTLGLYVLDSNLRTPFNLLLLNVVILELISVLVGLPFSVMAAVCQEWIFGETLCTITGLIMATSGIGSIGVLSGLSVQRCLLVALPHISSRVNSVVFCRGLLLMAYVYTFLVLVPIPMGFSYFKIEAVGISCGPAWDDGETRVYTLYLLTMGYVLPIIVIATSTILLIYVLRKRSSQMQMAALRSSMAKKELRVTRMVLAMLASFLMVWSPYAICSLLVVSGLYTSLLDQAWAILPVIFAKTSVFVNPLLYLYLNPQFQRALRARFGLSNNEDNNVLDFPSSKTAAVAANTANNNLDEDEDEDEEEDEDNNDLNRGSVVKTVVVVSRSFNEDNGGFKETEV